METGQECLSKLRPFLAAILPSSHPPIFRSSHLLILLILLCALSSHAQLTLTGFKFAVPFDQTNAPAVKTIAPYKSLFTAKQVVMLSNGVYAATTMRIESYQQDGKTNLIARGPESLFDPERKVASSTNRLEMESPNGLLIEGRGFLCFMTNFNLIISNDVRTYVRQQLIQKSSNITDVITTTNNIAGTNIALTIFADRFDLDYAGNLIVYTGHVKLEHSQLLLMADRLTLQRATNGTLDRVVADKNVTIVNKLDNSQATGDLAVYIPGPSDVIQWSGNAKWHDAQRKGRADLFIFEPRAKHLRAEGNASISLPRQSVAQPEFWAGNTNSGAGGNRQQAGTSLTNAPVEISAHILDLQMGTPAKAGTTNAEPSHRFMVAERDVTIVSPSDKSFATADRAVFDERTGMLELTGKARWEAGDRVASGEALQYDRTNKIFMALGDACLRVPVADLAKRSGRAEGKGTNLLVANQTIEIRSAAYTYTSNMLVFRENVHAKLLEEKIVRGTMDCAFLGLRFSNQLETAVATGKVRIEQLPFERLGTPHLSPRPDRGGAPNAFGVQGVKNTGIAPPSGEASKIGRKLECEQLHIRMGPGGALDRIVATTNVVADQYEWRKGTNKPIHSHFSADILTADFFPRTNRVREAVADGKVVMVQDQRSARGDRAVYTGTNDMVELTGNPTAESPEAKISDADVLLWDRKQNSIRGRNVKGEGTAKGKDGAPLLPLPKPGSRR